MENKEIEAYSKIIEVLSLRKRKDGFYHTSYGRKTDAGIREVMAGILRDFGVIIDRKSV